MKNQEQWGRWGVVLLLGLGACEVLIMISPFAGFFYASLHFQPLLGFLSNSSLTAWLDGFFLNHSVVTTSRLLEWQRQIGLYLFALGGWGFLISAAQVYGNKLLRRGVATGFLYRISRHPQYLGLGVAGWGLLTIWPRFLLLGIWVTMLFLYAGLARFEERRMEERFGEDYLAYARTRGAFLPGNPVRRVFEATFGSLLSRPLAWLAAYAFCLLLAFSLGGALRGYTRSHTVIVQLPQEQAVVISAWPQTREWAEQVFEAALADGQVRERLGERHGHPLVATILPPRYVMKGMFYQMPPTAPGSGARRSFLGSLAWIGRTAFRFLVPLQGITRSNTFMGVDPDEGAAPVEVVISRAEKPYKQGLALAEALDASVRLTPLTVVDVQPQERKVLEVRVPLPQNRWGPHVVMPLF
ncbi:MAG: methyltransferase family protein [Acidobacteriota bacterium]